jgi:flagellar hook-associated protein 1 FlgK
MGLTVVLSNALSGMRSGQNGLDVLSRNVANAGVPGYHRQSLSVVDMHGANSAYARNGVVTRAFSQSLQLHYTRALSDSGFSSVRANYLDRLQSEMGKPGSAGSLDTAFAGFHLAMSQLAVSPEAYATRADAVAKAGVLAERLNQLSQHVQMLRSEAEDRIAGRVEDLNRTLQNLERLNGRIGDLGMDPTSRAAMLDQRDRLVSDVSALVDVRTEYRADGTVALMTRSGVGLLDGRASVLEFESAGMISANSRFDVDPDRSGVGALRLRTPAGLVLDLVQQNVIRSGELGGLIELRDRTLVRAQDQLDDVAAALAQALSTVETEGAPASSGGASGYSIDLATIRNGNDFELVFKQAGAERSVRVIRVDDPSRLPMEATDAAGNRIIGLDLAAGAAAVAPQLQELLGPGFDVSVTVGGELLIVDDGAADTTDVLGLATRTTVTANQGAGLALALFVDAGNVDFTDALDGAGQRRGFAARIAVNAEIAGNTSLLVQFGAGVSQGDDHRPDYLIERLDTMRFATYEPSGRPPDYRLAGGVSDIIGQVMDQQGGMAASALSQVESDDVVLEMLTTRMGAEYGVDVDEEMARLMQLQNAYAANARVLSTVQELLDRLMAI